MGIYDGEIAKDDIKDYVNHSDAILNIGAKLTDSPLQDFHINLILTKWS